MACFHPLEAWHDGLLVRFGPQKGPGRSLLLPCGRCIGCRLVRVRSWAIRCMHESQMHSENCFITLTYDDSHFDPSLDYGDYQLFMRRLRKEVGQVRFFMCGEYGDENLRPHFHALLFGYNFRDRKAFGKGFDRSAALERLWPNGYSSVGDVTAQSAAYCARYALKKLSGDLAVKRYSRVDISTGEIVRVLPEFARMSLKPGIGYTWFQKYWRDVFAARDGVVQDGGRIVPPPRYYFNLLDTLDGDLKEYKEFQRYVHSLAFADDCTPERLAQREVCALARENLRKRSL